MLDTPIESLPRTSVATIKRLKSLGINTYRHLIAYYPARYDDLSRIVPIATVQPGENITVQGVVESFKNTPTRRGMRIQQAILMDGLEALELTWYNQQYLSTIMKPGVRICASGPIERFKGKLCMKPTEYEVMYSPSTPLLHTGRIVPVYPQIYGLSSRTIREKIWYILNLTTPDDIPPLLPQEIVEKNGLLDRYESIKSIHFPSSMQLATRAKYALAFEEIFIKMLTSHMVKKKWQQETVTSPFDLSGTIEEKLKQFRNTLPFTLTAGQSQSVDEILSDLRKQNPMNRFLQGDVGSGKTVVSAVAAYATYLNKKQTLYMAPTEILAIQHHATLSRLMSNTNLQIALQTGAQKTFKKKAPSTQDYDIIVGTHALLTSSMQYDRVGLVIIDEQHRFGVRQRAILKQKGINPHLLTMTATPIPRTVSLTLYSELDMSIIAEMPKGRLPIKTHVVPQEKRAKCYEWIRKEIHEKGIQVYIICPLISESEVETMKSIKAAEAEYEHLKNVIFKKERVIMLHGKMKGAEKERIMQEYKEKRYDILVSTSVVEVGIDVPNATIMIIEGSERFGLSQLHQLRGRVGRGDKQSYCFLFTSTQEDMHKSRLHFFSSTNSGMKLAEYDLKLRGPGDIFGTAQSGYSDLKIAEITDYHLVKRVKDAMQQFVEKYDITAYPQLNQAVNTERIEEISRD